MTETVTLDIDTIPQPLYDLLLESFQVQHGLDGAYVDWKITATKEVVTS